MSMSGKRIVVMGGGTGTYTVLRGLKQYTQHITAVVTMADDGGSSGRLRDELGHLPQGDIRRCLVALSANREVNRILRDLFEYRFNKGEGLNGHSFGNLFLAALTELTGSVEGAILEASRLLNVRGTVLPVTTDNVRLNAELEDGTFIWGEKNIDVRKVKPELHIKRVFLAPTAQVNPRAGEAIEQADILVLGPGDLYTSLIPNLLVEGVADAIRKCRGVRMYICNMMTKHGETDGFTASDFLAEVVGYLGGNDVIDCMVVNNGQMPADLLERYTREHAFPVQVDLERAFRITPWVIQRDLLTVGNLARHDSHKLARLIMEVGRSKGGSRQFVPAAEAVTRLAA